MAAMESAQAAARAADDLYRRHGGEVYRYALAVLGNHADAEDVTQTTFLNAYRSLEQGVRPRKASNWLLVIAGNAIKQKFRQESARPREVALDDRVEDTTPDDTEPTVGELMTALSRIPPHQRQAIVLREFEGRSYKEIAEILGVTTSALETLLFRARRSLADELEQQLTCADAQFAISQAADGRIARKEKRRLRRHVGECPDCARFAKLQQRQRRALRGLALVPVPVSLSFESSAKAATLPALGTASVAAASVAGGVGVVGATKIDEKPRGSTPARAENSLEVADTAPAAEGRAAGVDEQAPSEKPGQRVGQVSTRPDRGRSASSSVGDRRARPNVAKPERAQGAGTGRTNAGRPEIGNPVTTPKPKAVDPPGLSRRSEPRMNERRTPRGNEQIKPPARKERGRRPSELDRP